MATTLITCDNKGCYSQDYHKLDLDSDKVFCSGCKQEIKTISQYMKKVLKSSNQTFKKARSSNELVCKSCGFAAEPVLLDYGRDVFEVACGKCKVADAHLTNYFIEPLKINSDIKRVKVRVTEAVDEGAGGDEAEDQLFDIPDIEPELKQAAAAVQDKASVPQEGISAGSWLSPKKSDRGAPPPGSIDGELAAQKVMLQAQVDMNANMPVQGILAPKQRGRSLIPRKPATAKEMLARAGVKHSHIEDEDDYEDEVQEVRKVMSKSPANRPKTAAEMLDRAGFELAVPDDHTPEATDTDILFEESE